jgi:hypothetical protein
MTIVDKRLTREEKRPPYKKFRLKPRWEEEKEKRSPEPTITPWGDRVLEEENPTEQDTNPEKGRGR